MPPGDLSQLVTLDALLQEESVSGAGRRLGDPLLVRAGRSMVLTPRAEVRDAVVAAERVFEAPAAFDPARLERCFSVRVTDHVLSVVGPALEERVRD